MIFNWPEDFIPGSETAMDLEGYFESNMPSFTFLKDSVLDPSLAAGSPTISSENWASSMGISMNTDAVARQLVKLGAMDNLEIGRRVFWDEGKAGGAGVLSGQIATYKNLFQAFNPVDMATLDTFTLESKMAIAWVGKIGNVLSSLPNIYAQIAGAVMGGILTVVNIANRLSAPNPPKSLLGVVPMQEPSKDTDMSLFNLTIRPQIAPGGGDAIDYTSLFAPRYLGDPGYQYRTNAGGQEGVTFGLTPGGGVGEDLGMFGPGATGWVGMMPGAQQITSLMQGTFSQTTGYISYGDQRYQNKTTQFCADLGCCYDAPRPLGNIAPVQDVGGWYPTSSNAMLALWTHMMRVSPAMYALDCRALETAWRDYYEGMYEVIEYGWGRFDFEHHWGAGAWRCMLMSLYKRLTVATVSVSSTESTGIIAGNLGAGQNGFTPGAPAADSDTLITYYASLGGQSQSFRWWWDRVNIFEAIIKPALRGLAERQKYYLEHTTIGAYVRPNFAAFKNADMADLLAEQRDRIRTTGARYEVRKIDVTDPDYQALLEDAGAFDLHLAALPSDPADVPPGAPTPPGGAGGWAPVGGVALPPPPSPQPEPSWSERYGPYLLGAAAVAGAGYVGYRAYKRRKPNGLYLPPGVE